MALEVIGAGFGRTGTTSLKAALEKLGFSKCHHMEEVVKSRRQVELWQAIALREDGETVAWDEVFDGFQASCDWPSCTYWEELAREYPDAKIILSVRDEERWYDSVAETIYPASYLLPRFLLPAIPFLKRFNRMVVAQVWQGVFGGRFEDREHALSIYRGHVAHVKATAPPERLLVFEAKEGWEPLCRFLDVPVPPGEYPHLNDAATIRRLLLAARVAGWGLVAGLAAGLLALLL
jgi:hypothetical protein